MNYSAPFYFVRRTIFTGALAVALLTGVSWGQATDGGTGTTVRTTTDDADDDGFDWGLLGLLGLAGLAGLKRRDDHVHTTNSPRV
jgi:MYXO-CTERM domain-containing protein